MAASGIIHFPDSSWASSTTKTSVWFTSDCSFATLPLSELHEGRDWQDLWGTPSITRTLLSTVTGLGTWPRRSLLSLSGFQSCFVLCFRVGFAQFIILQGLLRDTLVSLFLWAIFHYCPRQMGIVHALSQSASGRHLPPPCKPTNFPFANTMILRDQTAYLGNVWDRPT